MSGYCLFSGEKRGEKSTKDRKRGFRLVRVGVSGRQRGGAAELGPGEVFSEVGGKRAERCGQPQKGRSSSERNQGGAKSIPRNHAEDFQVLRKGYNQEARGGEIKSLVGKI